MPFRISASARLFQQSKAAPPANVWITDEVLAHAFNRYLRLSHAVCKRNGSSVPGPLEARKRLCKRRMVGAASQYPTADLDLYTLFRTKPTHRKSAQPSSPSKTLPLESSESFFSWVKRYLWAEPISLETFESAESVLQSPSAEAGIENRIVAEVDKPLDVYERLSVLTSAEDIRTFIYRAKNEVKDAEASRLISAMYDRLLELRQPIPVIFDFLADPMLDHRRLNNRLEKILAYFEVNIQPEERPVLSQHLGGAIFLGVLFDNEICSIFKFLPKIASLIEDKGASTETAELYLLSLYQSLWDCIKASPVVETRLLDATVISSFVTALSKLPFSTIGADLASEIVAFLPHGNLHTVLPDLTKLLAKWVHAWDVGVSKIERPVSKLIPIEGITRLINILPFDIAEKLVHLTTRDILAVWKISDFDGTTPPDIILPWVASIQQSQLLATPTKIPLDSEILFRAGQGHIATMLNPMDMHQVALVFFRLWQQDNIAEGEANSLLEAQHDLSNQERAILMDLDATKDYEESPAPFLGLITSMNLHGVDYNQTLNRISKYLLRSKKPHTLAKLMFTLKESGLEMHSKMHVKYVRAIARSYPILATNLLDNQPHLETTDFSEAILKLAKNPLVHPRMVEQIVEHRFNRREIPQPDWPYLSDYTSMKEISRKSENGFETNRRSELAHLYTRMAWNFSRAQHLTLRQSWRYVYRCYLALHSHYLPINGEVLTALAHAAVVRQLARGFWISNGQLEWIVKKIAEVEGDEVARRFDEKVFEWRRMLSKIRVRTRTRTAIVNGRKGIITKDELWAGISQAASEEWAYTDPSMRRMLTSGVASPKEIWCTVVRAATSPDTNFTTAETLQLTKQTSSAEQDSLNPGRNEEHIASPLWIPGNAVLQMTANKNKEDIFIPQMRTFGSVLERKRVVGPARIMPRRRSILNRFSKRLYFYRMPGNKGQPE